LGKGPSACYKRVSDIRCATGFLLLVCIASTFSFHSLLHRSIAISVLYSGHWPAMQGEEVRDFMAQSRQTVDTLDRPILTNLEKHREGLTLRDLIDVAATAVGDWPNGW
jgi:hypothetical protein